MASFRQLGEVIVAPRWGGVKVGGRPPLPCDTWFFDPSPTPPPIGRVLAPQGVFRGRGGTPKRRGGRSRPLPFGKLIPLPAMRGASECMSVRGGGKGGGESRNRWGSKRSGLPGHCDG